MLYQRETVTEILHIFLHGAEFLQRRNGFHFAEKKEQFPHSVWPPSEIVIVCSLRQRPFPNGAFACI